VVLNQKPIVVPTATATATAGEIIIAMNIGTWLANVNDAKSVGAHLGMIIGINMPIAVKSAAIVIFCVLQTLLF
jgi:hypothetical protein